MKKQSEFGKGLTYCIGLFLMHAERKFDTGLHDTQLWFNGASDHVYDLNIPEALPKGLQEKISSWRDKVLDLGHGSYLMKDVPVKERDWAIAEAKEILMAIDKHLKAEVVKGSWE
jgi:hypothetical protein